MALLDNRGQAKPPRRVAGLQRIQIKISAQLKHIRRSGRYYRWHGDGGRVQRDPIIAKTISCPMG